MNNSSLSHWVCWHGQDVQFPPPQKSLYHRQQFRKIEMNMTILCFICSFLIVLGLEIGHRDCSDCIRLFSCRIVRNKAAEKAKHAHHNQGSSPSPHSPPQQTPSLDATRPSYSINGILGIDGKRKRQQISGPDQTDVNCEYCIGFRTDVFPDYFAFLHSGSMPCWVPASHSSVYRRAITKWLS